VPAAGQPHAAAGRDGVLHALAAAQIATDPAEAHLRLGNIAVQTLLVTKTASRSCRGRLTQAQGVPVLPPTFHPAYILRNMSELPLFETGHPPAALQSAASSSRWKNNRVVFSTTATIRTFRRGGRSNARWAH
jgi:hypothetical protein